MEPLGGIAEADALLGRRFPLPRIALPLARWVEVERIEEGVQVAWNLDDSREGTPGRLVLLAAAQDAPLPTQLPDAEPEPVGALERRRAPLAAAQPSLRPVTELRWHADGLALRLTGQGAWVDEDLLAIAAAVVV